MADSIAQVLRRFRGDMTQAALAAAAGISESTITHVETGRRNLGADNVRKIAAALELTNKERAELEAARQRSKAPLMVDEALKMVIREAMAEERAKMADDPEKPLRFGWPDYEAVDERLTRLEAGQAELMAAIRQLLAAQEAAAESPSPRDP